MSERRTTRRYDLSLPLIIRVPAEKAQDSQQGKTRDISTRGLYFVIDQNLEAGSELDLTLTLPSEVTHGSDVHVRVLGKVVRVEKPRTPEPHPHTDKPGMAPLPLPACFGMRLASFSD